MQAKRSVIGLFTEEDSAADALDALRDAGYTQSEYEVLTGTPYPEGTFGEAEPVHKLYRFPLVGAICTPDEVWAMVDEMVVAQAQWLPQYADAVPAAKERIAKSTVKTRDWDGAARKKVRSVEELREMSGAHH